ncbi:MAG: serine acetyltransferase [Tannerellaceae bacterium]|nr:serine acetyltransferase [Tannerellaceae bacterium]MCD8263832.1 serine acetyltransferase [Tannerellaceae bacterium]
MEEYKYIPPHVHNLPNMDDVEEIVKLIKAIVFPGFFGVAGINENTQKYYTGVNIEKLYLLLKEQISKGLHFFNEQVDEQTTNSPEEISLTFIDKLPEIKRLLCTDIKAVFDGDPAARSYGEVIFCYPAIRAMIHYRIAHALLQLGVPVLPRIITELAHAVTGIDIHPGASIGEYFSIDHGTGVVIGETCIIGNYVKLYQGVTLGAKSFKLDEQGLPVNIPRHPILEDHVIVYSNSTILGRITIGHHSIIGGNIWQTNPVPPYSRILQQKAVASSFTDGLGI